MVPRPAPAADFDPYPLDPPDTSSPRATLHRFIANMNAAYQAHVSGGASESMARPFQRAIRCLDLSGVAESVRADVGGFSVLLLKEILDRIQIPESGAIPGADLVEFGGAAHWTIPRTEITIARVGDGARAGEFLFTPDTVARLPEFYERAKGLPYKPDATQDLLDIYLDNPGGLVPRHVAEALPEWVTVRIFDRPIWKWGALAAFFAVSVAMIVGVYRLGALWDRQYDARRSHWRVGILVVALVLVLWAWALDVFVDDIIGLRGPLEAGIKRGALVFSFCAGIFTLFALLEIISSVIVATNRIPVSSAQAHFIRIVLRLFGIGVAAYVVVEASAFLGWAVAPLLAGLGVGGLAVALAARPTLENVIAGLILFADKPVRVGDFCRFGDRVGTVEEVGLRSTRIRSLDRTLISIPNAEFSQMQIENFARRDSILFQAIIGLRYETTPDQLRHVLAKLREMLIGHPKVSPDPARARFWAYGPSSIDIEIFAYVRTRDWNEYLAIREDLNLRILDIVRESGTSVAFPSQTVYWRRDADLDGKRRDEAEARMADLRARGQLPFPEFDEASRSEMTDVLAYPPPDAPDSDLRTAPAGPEKPDSEAAGGEAERARRRGKRAMPAGSGGGLAGTAATAKRGPTNES